MCHISLLHLLVCMIYLWQGARLYDKVYIMRFVLLEMFALQKFVLQDFYYEIVCWPFTKLDSNVLGVFYNNVIFNNFKMQYILFLMYYIVVFDALFCQSRQVITEYSPLNRVSGLHLQECKTNEKKKKFPMEIEFQKLDFQ